MCLLATSDLRVSAIIDAENAEYTAPKRRLNCFANLPEELLEEVPEAKQAMESSFEGYVTATTGSLGEQTCSSEESDDSAAFECGTFNKGERQNSHLFFEQCSFGEDLDQKNGKNGARRSLRRPESSQTETGALEAL